MGRINNLDEDPMVEVMRRLKALERAAPVGFTEISRGALIVSSIAGLIVRGSASVTGFLTGIGQLLWSGIVSLTGTVNISGPLGVTGTATIAGPTVVNGTMNITGPDTRVTGPFHVSGDQDNTGKLTVQGATRLEAVVTLLNNLIISSGGKVTAGDLTITPTGELTSPSNIVVTAPRLALSADLRVAGQITNPGMTDTTSGSNVFVNLVGELQRVGSAARLKIDAERMALPDELLSVSVKHWIDMGSAERFAVLYKSPRPFNERDQMDFDGVELHRIPGVIAEEVRDAGGSAFVSYDEAGQILGVAYDRFALARTQILADQLAAALDRIAALERAAA
jgi:hypothetical protein